MRAVLRVVLVVVTVVLLQLALFNGLRIADVAPEFVLALSLAAGVTGGSERGAVVGFFAGLCYDLFLATPFGLSALTYCLVAYGAGMLANAASDANWWVGAPVIGLGTAVGLGLYVLLGELLGQAHFYTGQLWQIILVASLLNAATAGVFTRIMRWAWHPLESLSAPPPRRFGVVN